MKKLLLTIILTMMMGTLTAQANEFPYLTFETTNGAKVSVAVESLKLTISGTTLTVGSQSFTLSNLSKMYFSTTDETNGSIDAIDDFSIDDSLLENAEIFDLNGRKVVKGSTSVSKLPRGVYIVKTNEKTCKITVK